MVTSRKDKYELIADKMLSLMEQDIKPWSQPWYANPYRNAITGHEYRGVNPLLCGLDCLYNNWLDPRFVTMTQCKQMKWRVVKGSKATIIRWGGTCSKKETDAETGEERTKFYSTAKFFNVFNIECVDDSESDIKVNQDEFEYQKNTDLRIEDLEVFCEIQGVKTTFGNQKAFYNNADDIIAMPSYEQFKDAISYYSVYIHELAHSTGHESRLKRDLTCSFGSRKYAFEELVAELTSVFICNEFNLKYDDSNHVSYLNNWMQLLRDDNKAFFKAAKLAGEASEFMLNNLF